MIIQRIVEKLSWSYDKWLDSKNPKLTVLCHLSAWWAIVMACRELRADNWNGAWKLCLFLVYYAFICWQDVKAYKAAKREDQVELMKDIMKA